MNGSAKPVSLKAHYFRQDGTTLYIGYGATQDLLKITTVDPYNPSLSPTDDDQGYQRLPEQSRVTQIGRFLIQSEDLVFPTAVLLAARQPLKYDAEAGEVLIRPQSVLQVVDGQHRLAGLRYAIEDKGEERLNQFPMPFIIMEASDKLMEMQQFRIINSNAKSVRTDLVNMLITKLYAETERNEIPDKDRWKVVISQVVHRLNDTDSSPWFGRVTMPGESGSPKSKGEKVVRATSFITSLRPVYNWLATFRLISTQTSNIEEEVDLVHDVVAEFWNGLEQVVPDAFENPQDYVIQKTPGLFSLHNLLTDLLLLMQSGRREFTAENFVIYLKESPEIVDPGFWHRDENRASAYGSMKGFAALHDLLMEAYRK